MIDSVWHHTGQYEPRTLLVVYSVWYHTGKYEPRTLLIVYAPFQLRVELLTINKRTGCLNYVSSGYRLSPTASHTH